MEKWFIKNRLEDFKSLSEKLSVSEVLVRLMVNRGLSKVEDMRKYLAPSTDDMHSPYLMKDIENAVETILGKIQEKKHIRIVGDYDVDGVISTFILYKTLERAGADIDYKIPDRIDDGYGINISIINQAIDDGVDTIITCDNGIAAIEQIEHANRNNITVVVLDHHDIPFEMEGEEKRHILPNGAAVVNPHREDCPYPFKEICAGQVVYKFAQVFYDKILKNDYELREMKNEAKDMEEYLAMAAIATVCDVMPLCDENRVFVKEGIKLINQGLNTGLKALMEVCAIEEVKAYHLGFVIGPCINASGRLESAKLALELFLKENYHEALMLAWRLKELNDERKQMTVDAIDKTQEVIQKNDEGEPMDKVIVVYAPWCHESIAGIVAGRIKELYNRPTVVITKGKDMCKGSGRSIEEYDMFSEIQKHRHLLEKFGGHPMAAGLSIKEENIEKLKTELNKCTILTEDDLAKKCSIDIELPISLLNIDIVKELDMLQPYGKDNEKPAFAERDVNVLKISILGKNNNVIKMKLHDKYGGMLDGMFYGDSQTFLAYLNEKFGEEEVNKALKGLTNDISLSIIYYPQINDYMGRKSVNIVISHYR